MKHHKTLSRIGSRFYKQFKNTTRTREPNGNPFQEHKINPWETHFKNMNQIEHQQVIPTD